VGFLIDKAYIMITTKINVDTSELLKAFKLLESQGKLTADNIDKAFNNSLKIEVDSSDFKKIETEATTMFGKLKNNLKGSFDMSQILNFSAGGLVTGAVEKGLSLVAEGFSRAIEKGSEFEKQLNAVGAITGQSGKSLDNLGESALELSKQFGGDANTQLGAFQGILSKFGAELANTPEALSEVTKNVNLLAKASGMDATQSMNALTDAMLQFGVDTTNADEVAKESARFMNLLAASAKVGAAEIPELTASMLQVGVSAKSAGIGAEEVTGALQRLAVGGKKGSEAGIGLRNVLGLLQKQSGEGEKILEKMGLTTLKLGDSLGKDGLAKTLDLVKNGLNNFGTQTEKNQAILQLFGAENSTVAGLLLENTKQITEFTKASTGTASGLEQAKINMQGFSESMSRLKANIDAILIKSFLNIKEVVTTVFDAIFIFFNNTVVPFFDTIFNSIGEAIAPLLNEVENMYNTFMSLFDGIGGGVDILGTLRIVFETLGSVIGTIIQIALQPSLLILRSLVKVYTLLYEGVGIAIDYFKKLASQGTLVGDFLKFIKDGFFALIDVIKKTVGFVGGLLDKFGLIKKDKSTDKMTKGFKDTSEYLEKIVTLKNESNNLTYKELKAKQDALANEINSEVKLGKIKSANAEELKKKIYEIGIANKKTEGTTDTGDSGKPKKVKIKAEAEIAEIKIDKNQERVNKLVQKAIDDTKIELEIRPKEITFKELPKIELPENIAEILAYEVETESDKLIKDSVKNIIDGFNKIDYTSIFKKKETAFDESLNEDRANLLTSLQQNEISYEEYSERLNEIDRNRRETQKEGNSEFINGLNQTLALSFENSNMLVSNSLSKSFEENSKKLQDLEITSEQFTTNITDNIGVALGGVMLATAQAGLEGRDLLKSLLINTIDAATAMVNAWAGALFVKEMTEKPFGTGALTYAAYMLGANALLGIGRAYVNSFKDGVINLQGAGTSTSDSIPAMLSKGESVINARSTAQNEPYLRFINNGGDMSKLVNMNMNTKNIENLLYTNNELLRSKNFNPSINNVNKFNVSSTSIKVVRGR
jgi:TP901 family phage tail tape measure protein